MRIVGLLVATLAAWGCAGTHDANGSGDPVADSLVASMEAQVRPSSVRLILYVTNNGDEPVDLTFRTSQRFDFVIRDADGVEVWRWSDDMAFLQAISHATLAPGESWDMEAVWDPQDRSGVYEATGMLTASEHEVQQATSFELP